MSAASKQLFSVAFEGLCEPHASHALHSGMLEEKRASLTALGAQLAGRGKAMAAVEGQLDEQQRNLDRLTSERHWFEKALSCGFTLSCH